MQNKVPKIAKSQKGELVREDLQPGNGEPGKGQAVVYQYAEKIPVEIREIVRISPKDFWALKHSFEEWASQWD